MPIAQLFLVIIALFGHLCALIWVVNVSHGSGVRGRWVDPLTIVGLGSFAAFGLVGALWLATHAIATWPALASAYVFTGAVFGGLAVPYCTWKLQTHQTPDGVRCRESTTLQLPASLPQDHLVGQGGRSWLLKLPGNESLKPVLGEYDITLPELPLSLDGLSILHITDLHMAPCYDPRFFQTALEECSKDSIDLVLITGDIVDHPAAIDWIVPAFSRLRGRLGQFAILGNHDLDHGADEIREALANAGFNDLEGRWMRIHDRDANASVHIGGTSAPWGLRLNPPVPENNGVVIVMSHSPDQFKRISKWGSVDLLLCGHNHGGQLRLPLIGPVLTPSIASRRYHAGFFRSQRTLMHVNRGLGAKFPLRWNCPPEITRIALRAPRNSDLSPKRVGMRTCMHDISV